MREAAPEDELVDEDRAQDDIRAHRAMIDVRKLREYVLDLGHARGRGKAQVFWLASGYDQTNYENLLSQLRRGVMENEPVAGKIDRYGVRFRVDIPVVGPIGAAVVRTGWAYVPASPLPRLSAPYVR